MCKIKFCNSVILNSNLFSVEDKFDTTQRFTTQTCSVWKRIFATQYFFNSNLFYWEEKFMQSNNFSTHSDTSIHSQVMLILFSTQFILIQFSTQLKVPSKVRYLPYSFYFFLKLLHFLIHSSINSEPK